MMHFNGSSSFQNGLTYHNPPPPVAEPVNRIAEGVQKLYPQCNVSSSSSSSSSIVNDLVANEYANICEAVESEGSERKISTNVISLGNETAQGKTDSLSRGEEGSNHEDDVDTQEGTQQTLDLLDLDQTDTSSQNQDEDADGKYYRKPCDL